MWNNLKEFSYIGQKKWTIFFIIAINFIETLMT